MADSPFQQRLAQLQANFANVAPQVSGSFVNPNLPQGDYEFVIKDAFVKETKKGALAFNMELMVASGEKAGEKTTKNYNFDNEKSLAFLKGDLITLQSPLDDITKLPDQARSLIGKRFVGHYKTDGTNCSTYINQYIGDGVTTTMTGSGETPTRSVVPQNPFAGAKPGKPKF